MDVFKNLCDGEGQILLETKNGCKVSYVTILILFWLFMKLVFISINIHSSPTVKTSKNVVKKMFLNISEM